MQFHRHGPALPLDQISLNFCLINKKMHKMCIRKNIGDKMRYRKDLSNSTSVRLSNQLRIESKTHAKFKGMSFSEFVRDSLQKNIKKLRSAEAESEKKTSHSPKLFD